MESVNKETREPLFIKENVVKQLLNWNECVEAIEQALVSVLDNNIDGKPTSSQTARTFTLAGENGVLLSMPGYIGNYPLWSVTNEQKHSTLACKLVTSFSGNSHATPPLPTILATILLFDSNTGKLKAIVEGTEITAWRTAATSLVATKHLYYNQHKTAGANHKLAILGTGTQGRIHLLGMLGYFKNFFSQVTLWNRTQSKAVALKNEIQKIYPSLQIDIANTSKDCVKNADVIVTATNSSTPLFGREDVKNDVHINAIGAGINHHSEVNMNLYQSGTVFIESKVGIQNELKGIESLITSEIGEIIMNIRSAKPTGISVFQSMGHALEDAVMANLIYQKYIHS